MDKITLLQPDDWHSHLRDDAALATTVPHTAQFFARAIVMPNLRPPVTTVEQAQAYRERILAHVPNGHHFEPLMTLYLTDNTSADELRAAKASDFIHAVKYYPAGATTHSDAGVTQLEKVYPLLEVMSEIDLPLLMHGETTDPSVDIFDREAYFIEHALAPLTERFPQLRMVLEHITTEQAVDFVLDSTPHVGATITVHHLLLQRNDMLAGGIRPHYYCLPILKRQRHQEALHRAAASGNPKFFLGTDSAPHNQQSKESDCGCAGIYTAHAALPLYAEAFEQIGTLDKLEAFASHHGADFYGLPRNTRTMTLEKRAWHVPAAYPLGNDTLIPLRQGESIAWQVV